MSFESTTPDLSGLIPPTPTETLEQARERIIAQVMARQKALSEQFSKVDHPFVSEAAQDDYELAAEEFRALIKCVVHLPQSVEGVRFLEGWHANRMKQVELLMDHARPGKHMVFGAGTEPVPISEDFARGMYAALTVVRDMFGNFPLELTVSEEPEDDPEE
jgi:hypothetical protein